MSTEAVRKSGWKLEFTNGYCLSARYHGGPPACCQEIGGLFGDSLDSS